MNVWLGLREIWPIDPHNLFHQNYLYFYLYKFYSQYIQYEEIGLFYIGFLPNSFLFTWKSKIVSIILSLLKLEHSSSPQRPRVQRPALQTTNIDQRPPPPAVRLHRHHTKRHHEVAHWKRASQWFFRTSTAGSRIFKGARQIWINLFSVRGCN